MRRAARALISIAITPAVIAGACTAGPTTAPTTTTEISTSSSISEPEPTESTTTEEPTTTTTSEPESTTTSQEPTTTLPLEATTAALVAVGGSTPLALSGSSRLLVTGDAVINRGNGGAGIDITGSRLKVQIAGAFELQYGTPCHGCSPSTVFPYPPTFRPSAVADPYANLPEPEPGPLRDSCPPAGAVRVCSPGVYNVPFPPALSGSFVLERGVYTLNAGLSLRSSSSIQGQGVVLYNRVGTFSVSSSILALVPPTDGPYAGISIFQSRENRDVVQVYGNATLSSIAGAV